MSISNICWYFLLHRPALVTVHNLFPGHHAVCYETNRAINVIRDVSFRGWISHQISTFKHAAQDRSLWPTVVRLHHTQDKERYQSIRQAHRPSVVLKKKHGMRNRHGDMTGTGLAQTWYVMNEVLAPCGLTVSEKGLKNTCQTPPVTCSYHKYTWKSFQILRLDDLLVKLFIYIFPAAAAPWATEVFFLYTETITKLI